ncbi:tRNA: m1A22 methyltransferase [Spiroplasma helicoides]|uniref:tRNA: m1A22 methyltransferase n=1 Tax=Spiroplasma helicoides TaxID=216938 RepID=A0A1B3SL10_9MOLU|nr:class I SAM-dependent methyltransferase [Spiroplasma helicoides]AOG60615.1 tRNA: m1A22 methyltransferase [Spiroplasma helicoides]
MSFLTPRLFAITGMISDGETVADIGTDHGYIAIYLAKDNKANKIFATDIAEQPLNVAKNNINSFGVSEKIETILADGISWVKEKNVKISSCIIAGMGSNTVLQILKEDNDNIDCYVISSNTNAESIRLWVKKKKYFIESETLVKDNGLIYEIFKINKFAGHKVKSKKDIIFGPIIIKNPKNSLFIEKWLNEEQKLVTLISKIPKSEVKYKQFTKRRKFIAKMLKKEKTINVKS